MKKTLILCLLCLTVLCHAQVKLSDEDLSHLIAISEVYSKNPNGFGADFITKIDSLRTPKLKNIADALIAKSKNDSAMLQARFWKKPSHEEMVLWYVVREIHYNLTNKDKKSRPNLDVAKEILMDKIDERWLLDNYYYRATGGLAMLFNKADLSSFNFNLDSLGLQNNTEF